MFDAAHDLKNRFENAMLWFFEKWDMEEHCDAWGLADHPPIAPDPDNEGKAVKILEALKDTIDAVPPEIIKTTEELYARLGEEKYEEAAIRGVQVVGFGFFPTDATEFVRALNGSLQLIAA